MTPGGGELSNRAFVFHIFKGSLAMALFFGFIALQLYVFNIFEEAARCFPVTIITSNPSGVEPLLNGIEKCSISVESEKMTFDSSIFNDYEALPIKDIYFYVVETPYENWERIKTTDGIIPEANPFLEESVADYLGSRFKYWTISFVISLLFAFLLIAGILTSRSISKKQFIALNTFFIISFVGAAVLFSINFAAVFSPLIYSIFLVAAAAYFGINIIFARRYIKK